MCTAFGQGGGLGGRTARLPRPPATSAPVDHASRTGWGRTVRLPRAFRPRPSAAVPCSARTRTSRVPRSLAGVVAAVGRPHGARGNGLSPAGGGDCASATAPTRAVLWRCPQRPAAIQGRTPGLPPLATRSRGRPGERERRRRRCGNGPALVVTGAMASRVLCAALEHGAGYSSEPSTTCCRRRTWPRRCPRT